MAPFDGLVFEGRQILLHPELIGQNIIEPHYNMVYEKMLHYKNVT